MASPATGKQRKHEGRRYLIAHLHGVWVAHNTKGDDPLRTTQSVLVLKHVSELSRNYNAPHIVFGGDLNLDHNTHALALLEQGFEGMPLRNRSRIRCAEYANPGLQEIF